MAASEAEATSVEVLRAFQLSQDASTYNNLKLAGHYLIRDMKSRAPRTVRDYVAALVDVLAPDIQKFMLEHADALDAAVQENEHHDDDFDWASAFTLKTTYLLRADPDKESPETPQFMYLRLAVQHYGVGAEPSLARVLQMFRELSAGYYTSASPTLFNAGTKRPQLASCFLLSIEDNTEDLLKTGIYYGGLISKSSGGLGFDMSKIRHSQISNLGTSRGLMPWLLLFNSMVYCVDQGSRRKGAATVYLRPDHLDVLDFINAVEKQGSRYERVHDLNIALWTPWLFFKRVREDGDWTLFDPKQVPELNNANCEELERLYLEAEANPHISPKHKKTIKARELFTRIVRMQRQTGMPYILHADACNAKSNQRHLGNIRTSNLCCEIVEYTDHDTIASCNLSSISLRAFCNAPFPAKLGPDSGYEEIRACYDFARLGQIARSVVRNLNRVIDINWYPLDKRHPDGSVRKMGKIHTANLRHRPLGIGVSGLAEALHHLDLAFEDPAAARFNEMVFACLYWNSLAESVALAVQDGPHESFPGSPFSQGLLQFDLWQEEFRRKGGNKLRRAEDDLPLDPKAWGQAAVEIGRDRALPTWDDLKRCVMKYGARNSLLLALMPTASTAHVMRNCESVEAHISNYYTRFLLKADLTILNRYLQWDLELLHLWNGRTVDFLLVTQGSIQRFGDYVRQRPQFFPEADHSAAMYARLARIEAKYKTMWEIPLMTILKLAARRGRYIDQSQSTNIFIRNPSDEKIEALHLAMDQLGLKTLYYLRTNAIDSSHQVVASETVEDITRVLSIAAPPPKSEKRAVCTDTVCLSCA